MFKKAKSKYARILIKLISGSLLFVVSLSLIGLMPVEANQKNKASKQIILGFAQSATQAKKEEFYKMNNLKPKKRFEKLGLEVVEISETEDIKKISSKLKSSPDIQFVEIDELVSPDYFPNDPSLSSQWYHTVMRTQEAWDISQGDNTVVAVCDSGVYASHPELANKLVSGWNVYDNNNDTSDISGHGTYVAGVIGAEADNAIGIAGIGLSTKIMPVRITSRTDGWAYYSDMADCVLYASDHGAVAANISYLGASGSATIASAARYMESKKGIVTTSAGNANVDEGYYAYDEIVSVSATASNDSKASFSSYGSFVDLSAPGVSMITTNRTGTFSYVSGTSFSAPCVAAVAALVKSVNPALDASDVKNILFSSAKDLGEIGVDNFYGWGRVDALAAVTLATTYIKEVDTTAPNIILTSPEEYSFLSGNVNIQASSSDISEISKVDFYINDSLIGTDSDFPYDIVWNTLSTNNGTSTVTVTAFDKNGNFSSDTHLVFVFNEPDTIAPEVFFTNLIDGEIVSGMVKAEVSATDNIAVAGISCYLDGVSNSEILGSTGICNFNLRKASVGEHILEARAMDLSENIGSVQVKVIIAENNSKANNDKIKPIKPSNQR